MGFTVQQATAALQQSVGSLEAALNSLLPSDRPNAATNGHSGRESQTTAPAATANGPAYRSDRADVRSRHQPSDTSHNERTGIYTARCMYMCEAVVSKIYKFVVFINSKLHYVSFIKITMS